MEHVIVADAQHTHTLTFDPALALQVVRCLPNMAVAIELDCQTGVVAEEIENVATEWMLSAEFEAGKAAAA